MESNDEAREQLRVAERAAAAPYIDHPKDPWWVVPAFGALASLIVLGVHLTGRSDVPDALATLPLTLVTLAAWWYVTWQRRRRGTAPSGRAPREVNRVLWWFLVGAVVVGVALFALATWARLPVAMSVAFVLTTAGMVWFGHAHERAALKVRERLG